MLKNRSKKILVITDHRTGGAGHVAEISGRLLERDDHNVEFFFACDYYKLNTINYIYNINASKKLGNIIYKLNPDVIMLHNFDNLLSPSILNAIKKYKNKNQVKVIMTIHDYHLISASNSLTYYKGGQKRFFNTIPSFWKLIYHQIDGRSYVHGLARIFQWYLSYRLFRYQNVLDVLICPSEYIFDKVETKFSSYNVKLIYSPNAFLPCLSNEISDDIVRIVFAGRLTKDKGIFDFLNSFVDEKIVINKSIEIYIIGDGPDLKKIMRLSLFLKDKITIKILGKLEHEYVKNHLKKADYVLLPSLCYENAPLTLIEGAFMRCKIITMNYGGMREIAQKLPSSILLNDFSTNSIMALVCKLSKITSKHDDIYHEFFELYSGANYMKKLSDLFLEDY